MAQQRIVGAIAQSEADFADAAGGRWPDRRLTVQLGQPFVIGKTRNAEIPLRDALDAQQAFFTRCAEQRQPRPGVNIEQLIYQRGDKGGLAAAAKAGDGQAKMPVNPTIHQRIKFCFESLHRHPVEPEERGK